MSDMIKQECFAHAFHLAVVDTFYKGIQSIPNSAPKTSCPKVDSKISESDDSEEIVSDNSHAMSENEDHSEDEEVVQHSKPNSDTIALTEETMKRAVTKIRNTARFFRPLKSATEEICAGDMNLFNFEEVYSLLITELEKDKTEFGLKLKERIIFRVYQRGANWSKILYNLHHGIPESAELAGSDNEEFPIHMAVNMKTLKSDLLAMLSRLYESAEDYPNSDEEITSHQAKRSHLSKPEVMELPPGRRYWNCGEINHLIDNCLPKIDRRNIKTWRKVFERENPVERHRRLIKCQMFLHPVQKNPIEDYINFKCDQARMRVESKLIPWINDDSDADTLVGDVTSEYSDIDTLIAEDDEPDIVEDKQRVSTSPGSNFETSSVTMVSNLKCIGNNSHKLYPHIQENSGDIANIEVDTVKFEEFEANKSVGFLQETKWSTKYTHFDTWKSIGKSRSWDGYAVSVGLHAFGIPWSGSQVDHSVDKGTTQDQTPGKYRNTSFL
ncbi:unnamed protein product [Allacma fusca]|uniref:Uncharacterized protein n=1 Tax=Allacma fusca TaxID=39272 RepID=A0A8J2K2F2_9HEXA|nr:unnamed protein product [Allacma fusca]